jgi:hypothetical protein
MAVTMKMTFFRDVILCSLVDFAGVKTILKMEAVHFSGLTINICHTTQCHIPKYGNHHISCPLF